MTSNGKEERMKETKRKERMERKDDKSYRCPLMMMSYEFQNRNKTFLLSLS